VYLKVPQLVTQFYNAQNLVEAKNIQLAKKLGWL